MIKKIKSKYSQFSEKNNINNFLLEIFSEEIPTSFHVKLLLFIEKKINTLLPNFNTEVNVSKNRITIQMQNLPHNITKEKKQIKGPSVEGEEMQVVNFCKKYNIVKANLIIIDNFFYFIQQSQDISIDLILQEFSINLINELSLYFSGRVTCVNLQKKWVMPVLNICCMLNSRVLPFTVGQLSSNDKTLINLNGKTAMINVDANSYEKKLKENFILYKRQERIEILKKGVDGVIKFLQSKEDGLSLAVKNDKIFQEIACIVDFPYPLICKLPDECMLAIEEVLILTLEKNQKYIMLHNLKNDKISSYFIAIAEGPRDFQSCQVTTKGFEKVAINRLNDAIFYQNKDKKLSFQDLSFKLNDIIFYQDVSVSDFIKKNLFLLNKVQNLTFDNFSEKFFNFDILNKLFLMSKIDLGSNLLSEFPELQGIIGYYYIKQLWKEELQDLNFNENQIEAFAEIIKYQYFSVNVNFYDDVIKNNLFKNEFLLFNILLKISSINVLWKNEKPTSSGDPFALKKTLDELCICLNYLKIDNYEFILENFLDKDIYKDLEVVFLQRMFKNYSDDKKSIKEEDFLNIKKYINEKGLSNIVVQKLLTFIKLKNNPENEKFFNLIKRIKGYQLEIAKRNFNNLNINLPLSYKFSIFKNEEEINYSKIEEINKWLNEEQIINEKDSVKTDENLYQIKILKNIIKEKIILV